MLAFLCIHLANHGLIKHLDIRRYIEAVRNKPDAPDNNPDWIDWASKKADWYDPTVARVDEFLGEREHGKDPDRKTLKERWLGSFYKNPD